MPQANVCCVCVSGRDNGEEGNNGMLEYWNQAPSGGTADRRPGGRSDRPPQMGVAQASAPLARRRVLLPEPVFGFPIIPSFPYSNIPVKF